VVEEVVDLVHVEVFVEKAPLVELENVVGHGQHDYVAFE